MNDNTLHTVSRLFLIFSIWVLATACASILSLPYAIVCVIVCCLAIHHVATMGAR